MKDIGFGDTGSYIYGSVDAYINRHCMQEEWDDGNTGRYLHTIQPDVGDRQRRQFPSRSTGVLEHWSDDD